MSSGSVLAVSSGARGGGGWCWPGGHLRGMCGCAVVCDWGRRIACGSIWRLLWAARPCDIRVLGVQSCRVLRVGGRAQCDRRAASVSMPFLNWAGFHLKMVTGEKCRVHEVIHAAMLYAWRRRRAVRDRGREDTDLRALPRTKQTPTEIWRAHVRSFQLPVSSSLSTNVKCLIGLLRKLQRNGRTGVHTHTV